MDKYLLLKEYEDVGVWTWESGIFETFFLWFFENEPMPWVLTNHSTKLRVESSTFTVIDSILEELWQKHQSKSEVEA